VRGLAAAVLAVFFMPPVSAVREEQIEGVQSEAKAPHWAGLG